jgi:hypothetical protein
MLIGLVGRTGTDGFFLAWMKIITAGRRHNMGCCAMLLLCKLALEMTLNIFVTQWVFRFG